MKIEYIHQKQGSCIHHGEVVLFFLLIVTIVIDGLTIVINGAESSSKLQTVMSMY